MPPLVVGIINRRNAAWYFEQSSQAQPQFVKDRTTQQDQSKSIREAAPFDPQFAGRARCSTAATLGPETLEMLPLQRSALLDIQLPCRAADNRENTCLGYQ